MRLSSTVRGQRAAAPGLQERFLRRPEQPATAADVTLGPLEQALPRFGPGMTLLRTHDIDPEIGNTRPPVIRLEGWVLGARLLVKKCFGGWASSPSEMFSRGWKTLARQGRLRKAVPRAPLHDRRQSPVNLVQHGLIEHLRAAKIATALLRHPSGQVAGAGLPLLRLAGGSEAETLLGPLVGLHLRHDNT